MVANAVPGSQAATYEKGTGRFMASGQCVNPEDFRVVWLAIYRYSNDICLVWLALIVKAGNVTQVALHFKHQLDIAGPIVFLQRSLSTQGNPGTLLLNLLYACPGQINTCQSGLVASVAEVFDQALGSFWFAPKFKDPNRRTLI